jgi:hypothetical protein
MPNQKSLSATELWRRPQRVVIADAHLIAEDFASSSMYPIWDAAYEGQALQALCDARSDAAAVAFTRAWGFLHLRKQRGRLDRFPLELFHLQRAYLLALVQLSAAIREGTDLSSALRALQTAKDGRQEFVRTAAEPDPAAVKARELFGLGAESTDPAPLVNDLTSSEWALIDQGIPINVLQIGRVEFAQRQGDGSQPLTSSLLAWAARTLAMELGAGLQLTLEPVRLPASDKLPKGNWILIERPIVLSLEDVLRWSVRIQYERFHHYVCEGCGSPGLALRPDQRFCSDKCSTRVRIARWRRARKLVARSKRVVGR